jgi:threonine dehydratase
LVSTTSRDAAPHPQVDAFADGVAVKEVGVECFRLAQELVDEVVLVETDQICAAIKVYGVRDMAVLFVVMDTHLTTKQCDDQDLFEDTRSITEPSGALALAGAKKWLEGKGAQGLTVAVVASGANMNFDRLRMVAERAGTGAHAEAMLATFISEEKGAKLRRGEKVRGCIL